MSSATPRLPKLPISPKQLLAIDFGNFNTVSEYFRDGGAQIALNYSGGKFNPSVIAISDKVIFGDLTNGAASSSTFFRNYKDLVNYFHNKEQLEKTIKKCTMGHYKYTIEELMVITIESILNQVKTMEKESKSQIGFVVPPWWDNAQRQLIFNTNQLLESKGIKIEALVDSTLAQAVDYSIRFRGEDSRELMCFIDFGYSSFSTTVYYAKITKGKTGINSRKITFLECGSTHEDLGGRDIDRRLKKLMIKKMKAGNYKKIKEIEDENHKIQLHFDPALRKLKENFAINDIMKFELIYGDPDYCYEETVTIEEFDEEIKDIIEKCAKSVKDALDQADLPLFKQTENVNLTVIELGGASSRIRLAHKLIQEAIGPDCPKITSRLNADECFAEGACYYMASMNSTTDISVYPKDDHRSVTIGGTLNPSDVSFIINHIKETNDLTSRTERNDDARNSMQEFYLSLNRSVGPRGRLPGVSDEGKKALKSFCEQCDEFFEETEEEVDPERFENQTRYWESLVAAYKAHISGNTYKPLYLKLNSSEASIPGFEPETTYDDPPPKPQPVPEETYQIPVIAPSTNLPMNVDRRPSMTRSASGTFSSHGSVKEISYTENSSLNEPLTVGSQALISQKQTEKDMKLGQCCNIA